MKSVWLPCMLVCLGMATGCSTSTADLSDGTGAAEAIVDPEWAKSDLSAIEISEVPKVQPIPDDHSEIAAAAERTAPDVRPFPDDGN